MEITKNNCKLCDKECKSGEETVFCLGPCHRKVHAKCIGFTPTALKFYRECKNLTYECDECLDEPNRQINETLKKVLSFMCIFDERLNRQEINNETLCKRIDEIKSELVAEMNKPTLSDRITDSSDNEVLKTSTINPAIIVRPKRQQKCSATRNDVNKKIIPSNIALRSVNNIQNGGIEIKCKNNEDLPKLHKKAMEEIGEHYTVMIQKIRNPKVRITNMSRKLKGDEIIDHMKRDNEFLREAVALKVLYVYDIKNTENYGTILEVDPKTFKLLMKQGTIAIGMNNCKVTECLNVLRCYKCCGYNHKANACSYKTACLRCGGEHKIKDCRSRSSICINCKVISDKHKLNLNFNHPAWSRECPVLLRKIDRAKRFINYTG